MKTKMLMSLFTLGIILFNMFSCKSNQPQENTSDEQILGMLKSFYSSYITENAKMPLNIAKIKSIEEKYCTINLLSKLENQELDYDPFLKAQDSNIDWLKTLTIKRDSTKQDLYNVSYIEIYSNTKVTIKLIVIKQEEFYKIDSVW